MIGAKQKLKSTDGFFRDLTIPACKECGSNNIVNNSSFLICVECGASLKNEINPSFNGRLIHHAPLKDFSRSTQIGSQVERKKAVNSTTIERLNKRQNYHKYDENRIKKAELFLSKIMDYLQITNDSLKKDVLRKFREITPSLNKSLRSIENLIPILMFYYCKVYTVIIDEKELINTAGIDNILFNKLKKEVFHLIPEYKNYQLLGIGKKKYVSTLLSQFLYNNFQRNQKVTIKFLSLSFKFLNKLWNDVKNRSENNIVGIIATSTFFCLEQEFEIIGEKWCKSKICRLSKAKESTISTWFKYFIGEKNFSCVKGKDKIVKKLTSMI
ncbi:MAG: hypothetical protein ACW980_24625 [Promethearchaeota archaeon]